jgi:type II secretory pathway pseudopilin PulG
VLAIAGLILLIVFLAVPALQRNSRNTQRKNDASNMLAGINEYITNNNGTAPTGWTAPNITGTGTQSQVNLGYYTGATDVTWANNNTSLAFASPITNAQASHLYVNIGAQCNAAGTDVGGTGATSRSVAITYVIETSGGLVARCQNS